MNYELKYKFSKRAFTLAEILVTLGIIGIVAALTIPNAVKKYQDVAYKAAYKRAYSALNQAFLSAKNKDLFVEAPNTTPRPTGFDKNFMSIMTQMKIAKTCTSGSDNAQCWSTDGEKYNSSYPSSSSYAYMDVSGMAWSQYWGGCSNIFVDTNGFKKPNQWGKDRFFFLIYDNYGRAEMSMSYPTKITLPVDNHSGACAHGKCGDANSPDYGTFYATSWILNSK